MSHDQLVPKYMPPTRRTRRLGRVLKGLRLAAGLSQKTVGTEVGKSEAWVSRVESGEIRITPALASELALAYGVSGDREQVEALREAAKDLNQPGWWQQLDKLSQRYLTYIGFEGDARGIFVYEPVLIHGLLQTEAYARAVVSVGQSDPVKIEQRLKARLTRQDVLTRRPPVDYHVIISAAALFCEVGGPRVLGEQLAHIAELATTGHITAQVLDWSVGARMVTPGGFTVLSYEDDDPDLGYVDTAVGEVMLDDPGQVKELTDTFNDLVAHAMSPLESVQRIRERVTQCLTKS